jgi:hypothetical protein
MILLHRNCPMVLKVHDLRDIWFILRCRDADGELIHVLIVIHVLCRRIFNVRSRCRLEVIRLCLAVLVVVVVPA